LGFSCVTFADLSGDLVGLSLCAVLCFPDVLSFVVFESCEVFCLSCNGLVLSGEGVSAFLGGVVSRFLDGVVWVFSGFVVSCFLESVV
jgi:hypothetical protein